MTRATRRGRRRRGSSDELKAMSNEWERNSRNWKSLERLLQGLVVEGFRSHCAFLDSSAISRTVEQEQRKQRMPMAENFPASCQEWGANDVTVSAKGSEG